jgi:hypothetical protein
MEEDAADEKSTPKSSRRGRGRGGRAATPKGKGRTQRNGKRHDDSNNED